MLYKLLKTLNINYIEHYHEAVYTVEQAKTYCDVTSKKILKMLQSMGVEISAGSLSCILLEHTDLAESEKNEILKAGLSHSYSQTDITGA